MCTKEHVLYKFPAQQEYMPVEKLNIGRLSVKRVMEFYEWTSGETEQNHPFLRQYTSSEQDQKYDYSAWNTKNLSALGATQS